MLSGKYRPYFMSACTQGRVFEFAKFPPSSAIRFTSVFECPVVTSAIALHAKRAPQGGNYHLGDAAAASDGSTFLPGAEYKRLRFAMQSFPSKWFVFSIHHRHTLLIVVI